MGTEGWNECQLHARHRRECGRLPGIGMEIKAGVTVSGIPGSTFKEKRGSSGAGGGLVGDAQPWCKATGAVC